LKRLGDFALSERSNSRNKGDSDQRADSTTVNSLRSFASWKFDVLDALAAGLDAREFQVAYCLLQFANNTTRAICPAQAKIAADSPALIALWRSAIVSTSSV
jgi:hypothetical protein